jgi:hypothetical protein
LILAHLFQDLSKTDSNPSYSLPGSADADDLLQTFKPTLSDMQKQFPEQSDEFRRILRAETAAIFREIEPDDPSVFILVNNDDSAQQIVECMVRQYLYIVKNTFDGRDLILILFALRKFDVWVFGAKINLYSDHNPLQYLVSCAPRSAKLTRWALSLTRYDLNVQHIKGTDNVSADFLSRCIQ